MTEVPAWDTWEWEVPVGTSATSLADLADRETTALLASIRALPTDALERPGTFDRWSARDVVAHCVAWAEICARVLLEMSADTLDLDEYDFLPVGEETGDELNEQQVEELRGETTDELVERLEGAGRGAATTLRGFGADAPAVLVLLTIGDHFAEHAKELRALAAVDV